MVKKRGLFDAQDNNGQKTPAEFSSWLAENPEPPTPGPEPRKTRTKESVLPFGIGDEEIDAPEWRFWKARQNAYNAWFDRVKEFAPMYTHLFDPYHEE